MSSMSSSSEGTRTVLPTSGKGPTSNAPASQPESSAQQSAEVTSSNVFSDIDRKARNTLVLPSSDTAPSWVPDAEVKQCMYCQDTFSLMKRRHHCRNCGFVVCSRCSLSRVVLSHTNNIPARVCDKCVTDLGNEKHIVKTPKTRKSTKEKKDKDSSSLSAANAPTKTQLGAAPQALGMIDVPSWTYAVKPFTTLGPQVHVGRVLVRIMSTQNIPRLDLAMGISSTSTNSKQKESALRYFVGLRVDSANSKTSLASMDANESEDETASRVFSASWEHETLFEVSDRSSIVSLQLQAMGPGLPSSGIPLGFASLPLKELIHQERVKVKLPVELSALLSASSNQTQEEPVIVVEAQYIYNSMGYLWSQFSTESESESFERPFVFSRFIRDFVHVIWEVRPLLWLVDASSPILSWQAPLLSALFMALFLYIAFYSWALLPLLCILFLRYMALQYHNNNKKKNTTSNDTPSISKHEMFGSQIAASEIDEIVSLCPSPRPVANSATTNLSSGKKSKAIAQKQAVEAARLADESVADRELVTTLMTLIDLLYHMLFSANPAENFSPSQSILPVLDSSISAVHSSLHSLSIPFSWEVPHITGAIFAFTSIILALSFFIDQTPLYIILGVGAFALRTGPVKFLYHVAQTFIVSSKSSAAH